MSFSIIRISRNSLFVAANFRSQRGGLNGLYACNVGGHVVVLVIPAGFRILDFKESIGGFGFNHHAGSGDLAIRCEPREGAYCPGGGHERGGCAEAQYG